MRAAIVSLVPRRLDSLTALRFPTAFAILLCHAHLVVGHDPGFARLQAGVTFFFVLSGFVITWGCSDMGARIFYRRRAARIVPVYLLAFALGLAASIAVGDHERLAMVVSGGTLTQAWVPQGTLWSKVDPPSWSLSVEAFFYLIFPMVAPFLKRLSREQRRALLVVCVTLVALWSLGLVGGSSWLGTWVIGTLPIVRLPEFVAGALLCLEVRDGLRVSWTAALCALGIASPASLLIQPNSLAVTAFAIVPSLLLVAAGASHDLRGGGVPQPLVELGCWSYALYLIHYPIFQLIGVRSSPLAVPVYVAACVLAIGVSGLVFRYYERPLERRFREARPTWAGVARWP